MKCDCRIQLMADFDEVADLYQALYDGGFMSYAPEADRRAAIWAALRA